VQRVSQRKASAMQTTLQIWTMFTGEQLSPDAGLLMSSTIFERPMEAQDIAQLIQLTGGEPLMSQRSAIEELQRSGRLRATTSVEEEVERIRSEAPPEPPDVDLNDLGDLPPEPET
jgi:organic radical activating enzyme